MESQVSLLSGSASVGMHVVFMRMQLHKHVHHIESVQCDRRFAISLTSAASTRLPLKKRRALHSSLCPVVNAHFTCIAWLLFITS